MAQPQTLNFDDLGAKPVPTTTPGPATSGMDFSDLGAKPVAPVSDNQGQNSPQPQAQQPTATISAVHEPTTLSGKLERWAQNVTDDIKYGTDLTGIGTVLKKMGAHGVYAGNSQGVGDFMASLPLGLLRAAKGTAELPQSGKRWQGSKDVVGGALDALTIPGSFVAPEASPLSKEGLLNDAANVAGKSIDAVSQAAGKVKELIQPSAEVQAQMTKDAIKHVLGTKANADVLDEAADRIGKTKLFSTVENELKLVKPSLDSELKTLTTELDNVLSKSPAQVEDAAHKVNQVMDNMISAAKAGVGDSEEAQKAINTVRKRVTAKLADEKPISASDVNQLKRLVGDEIRKFAPPENLTSAQKWEQEAYRQTYFRLRDLVSEAVPESAKLNERISKGIQLQDLLEKKFPHLETKEAAEASYQAARHASATKAAVKAAKVAGASGLGYEAAKGAISQLAQP